MGSTATILQMWFLDYCDCFYSLFHVIADGGRMTQKHLPWFIALPV